MCVCVITTHANLRDLDRFVAKTLSDTQKFLQKEDPEKTLQTDYIETVVNQRTANARASAGKRPAHRHGHTVRAACVLTTLLPFAQRTIQWMWKQR